MRHLTAALFAFALAGSALAQNFNLFGPDAPPTVNTPNHYNFGTEFYSSVPGTLIAIRWYKDPLTTNDDPAAVALFSADGTRIASLASTPGETASGWQIAAFPTPIRILAGQRYVASYHVSIASKAAWNPIFASSASTNPLTFINSRWIIAADATIFPTNIQSGSRYADVVFVPDAIASWLWGFGIHPDGLPSVTQYQLATVFASERAGYITGVKFYKQPDDTGAHTVNLWSKGLSLLPAPIRVDSETASGWQTVRVSPPVRIAPTTEYVVSYHYFGGGHFSALKPVIPFSELPLRAIRSQYANTSSHTVYPNQIGPSWYFVDVIFLPVDSFNAVQVATPQDDVERGKEE